MSHEKASDASFTVEDLRRDTIIGRPILESLVESADFTLENLRRDTYVSEGNGFPSKLVSLASLDNPARLT